MNAKTDERSESGPSGNANALGITERSEGYERSRGNRRERPNQSEERSFDEGLSKGRRSDEALEWHGVPGGNPGRAS
jgi:hypothetical protein